MAARQLFRKIQVAAILDRIEDIVEDVDAALDRGESVDSRYLRFLVHLILLCRSVDFKLEVERCDRLIAAYVDLLIEGDQRDFVLLYASSMSRPVQVQKLAQLFQSI